MATPLTGLSEGGTLKSISFMRERLMVPFRRRHALEMALKVASKNRIFHGTFGEVRSSPPALPDISLSWRGEWKKWKGGYTPQVKRMMLLIIDSPLLS